MSVSTQDEVEEALATMQRAGSHLARVVDHDGRTLGVLFLEDVLEELVGEVRDATRRLPREPDRFTTASARLTPLFRLFRGVSLFTFARSNALIAQSDVRVGAAPPCRFQ